MGTNVSFPRGLWPIRNQVGGEIRMTEYPAGGTIYQGDLVKLSGGLVVVAAAGDEQLLGVALNYTTATPTQAGNYDPYMPTVPGTTAGTVLVADDPKTVFGIELSQTNGGVFAANDIGEMADIIAGSGNTLTHLSGYVLDANTLGGDLVTAAQLRVLSLITTPDNFYGDKAKIEVIIVEHLFNAV